MQLEQNIKALCAKSGINFDDFLDDMEVENVMELTIYDLEAVSEEYETDIHALLFKQIALTPAWKKKIEKIKLLILDVDGVMTDGGMYFTENGDQIKKYNTKDGMAIRHLTTKDFQVAIISSGFQPGMVEKRAEMLGIQNCIVSRDPKIDLLKKMCAEMNLELENVAIIGDDINDLDIIKKCGFSACPADAVEVVKSNVDLILKNKGGQGCVREFIDLYLLAEPLK